MLCQITQSYSILHKNDNGMKYFLLDVIILFPTDFFIHIYLNGFCSKYLKHNPIEFHKYEIFVDTLFCS